MKVFNQNCIISILIISFFTIISIVDCDVKTTLTCNGNSCDGLVVRGSSCPEGFYNNGTNCIKVGVTSPQSVITSPNIVETNCPPGFQFNGTNCIGYRNIIIDTPENGITCPPNYNVENGKCVLSYCANGVLTNGKCVETHYTCPPNYNLINDQCIPNTNIQTVQNNPGYTPSYSPEYGNGYVPEYSPGYTPGYTPTQYIPGYTPGYNPTPEWTQIPLAPINPIPVLSTPQEPIYITQNPIISPPLEAIQPIIIASPPAPAANISTDINLTNVVNNNNTVDTPTNINTANLNNITITMSRGGKCFTTIQHNNETTYNDCSLPKEPESESVDEQQPQTQKQQQQNCCKVVTPRRCKRVKQNWECTHRRYRRCGPFCTKPVIYLKPEVTQYRPPILTIPPPPPELTINLDLDSGTDCSGCINGGYNCSPNCFKYDCKNDECDFMDQASFCNKFGGEGCD